MQEIISITGFPFSGVGFVGKIVQNLYGFKTLSANTLLDSIYNDLNSIMQFTYPQRTIAKNDVLLKNDFTFEQSLGIPAEVGLKYISKWIKPIEDREPPTYVKWLIYQDLCLFSKIWRKLFIRADMVDYPTRDFCITHAYSLGEYNITSNNLRIWVECDEIKRYQIAFSHGVIYDTAVYSKKFIYDLSRLKNHADFILYNDGDRRSLLNQTRRLLKEIGIEKIKGQKPVI